MSVEESPGSWRQGVPPIGGNGNRALLENR